MRLGQNLSTFLTNDATEDEENSAIETLDGATWMGRNMKVNKARPRENNRKSFGGGNSHSNSNFAGRRY